MEITVVRQGRSRLARVALSCAAALVLVIGSAQIAPRPASAEAGALTYAQAVTMFNSMVAASKTSTSSSNFIEWRYPEDGCWARTYIALRIMHGLQPAANLGRTWALGQKQQAYRDYYLGRGPIPGNQPWTLVSGSTLYGYKTWEFHVSPTARVIGGDGTVSTMVLDYSMFDYPATISQWKARLSGVYGWYQTGYSQANPVTFTGTGYWLNNDPSNKDSASHGTMVTDHNAAVALHRY